MTDVEELVIKDRITTLVARRVRALDAKDWAAYAACHAEDHISHALPDGVLAGRDAVVEATRRALADVCSIHQVHSPDIVVLSATEASGIWAMEDRLSWTQGVDEHWLHGWGHYHDTYGLREGQWVFTSRKVVRQRIVHSPGSSRA